MKMSFVAKMWCVNLVLCLITANFAAAWCCLMIVLYETGVFQPQQQRRSGEPGGS